MIEKERALKHVIFLKRKDIIMNVYIHCCKVEKRTLWRIIVTRKNIVWKLPHGFFVIARIFGLSQTPRSAQLKKLLPRSAVHYSYYLKLNNNILNSVIHN